MTEFHLTGFVGDIIGDEHRLTERAPVIRVDGREFIPRGLNWKLSDNLHTFTPSDEQYIWRINNPVQVSEGDTVWLAGPVFHWALHVLGDDAVRHWRKGPHGFRYLFGSRPAFASVISGSRELAGQKPDELRAQLLLHGLGATQ